MARILLLTHIFPPAIDGGSKVISKFGEYLKTHGHDIMVFTSNCQSTDDFTRPYHPIAPSRHRAIVRLPVYTVFHRPFKLLSKHIPIFSVFKTGPIFKTIPLIKAIIKIIKFKPDYIIAGPLPTTIVLYSHLIRFLTKALSRYRAKLLINASFHSTDKDFHNPFLISCLKNSDYLWTLTDFETEYFAKNFGISKSKMINVGNGVDSSFLANAPTRNRTYAPKRQYPNALTLLYIGSFSAHKGIETLIDAFAIVSNALTHQRSNALTLCIAGQPTLYSPIIETKIKSLPLKIRKNIKVIYNFNSKALTHLLDQSAVLISPSTQESFGLVLIEAMARGKPVIATDIPASVEIVNKTQGGLLFKTNNPNDLASKILKLLRSKALRLSLGQKGFDYVQSHYTWDRIGEILWQKISS